MFKFMNKKGEEEGRRGRSKAIWKVLEGTEVRRGIKVRRGVWIEGRSVSC